jgi:branched-chain amino acid transport system permease protein
MSQVILFALLGLGPGALIAAIALGVVLTYRGSGVINLAAGALAMLGGYAFWGLRAGQFGTSFGTAPAVIASLLIVLAFGTLAELLVFRPMRTASPLGKLVASLGILLITQAGVVLMFGTTPQAEPSVLPRRTIHMLGAAVPIDRFILTGIVVAMAAALAALYRWSRFGLATRAGSENQAAAMLSGLSPNQLSLANTLLASLAAGVLGILAASITELDPTTLPLQVVPALAAALLAGFTSFGIACVAGLGLGIMGSLIQYASSLSWFPTSGGMAVPGVEELATFLVIALALHLRGSRLPDRGDLLERGLPWAPRPGNLARPALIIGVACAVGLVVLPYDFREALINTLIGTVMALSLVVLTGFVGQISVAQLALAGVSGFVISHLAVSAGIGFPVAPLIGVVAAVGLGTVTALSALRIRGVSLAVVTLAAAVAIENFGFNNPTWGGGATGSPVPSPHLFGVDLGPSSGFRGLDGNIPSPVFGWVALVTAVVACLLVAAVRRGRLGQRMLAVRSNERAAAASGINSRNVKLTAFAISALIAGGAGSLYAYNFGSVSVDRFDVFTALSLIAFSYAGGITLISGAVLAGLISTQALLPYALSKWFGLNGDWFLLFGGVMLIVTLVQNPAGVAGDIYRRLHKRPVLIPPVKPPEMQADPPAPATGAGRSGASPVLRVRGLSVAFGGVHALDGVDLEVGPGELVGLIGPNGAGKTTFVDAVTGFVTASGTIELDGCEVGCLPAHERARSGVARTWQGTELFDDLDVRENLTVACRKRPNAGAEPEIERVLTMAGLRGMGNAMPPELSEGQRRMVGLARALVGRPRLLLLDEPGAGLDVTERQELARRLRALADSGQSTLLIDHDMRLVLGICDRVVTLRSGKVIANDIAGTVDSNPAVIAAYLGSGTQTATNARATAIGGAPAALTRRRTGVEPRHALSRGRASGSGTSPAISVAAVARALEIDGLTAGYDGPAVVHDVSLSVAAGEVIALLGINGAGKTTALRAISGLVRPSAGTIRLVGQDLARLSPPERVRAGIVQVAQDRGIFRGLTVSQHFRLDGVLDGEAEAYRYFPSLQPLRARRAGLLSGGEQQMLAIARALVRRPRVLLLDEFTTGLAPPIVERLLPLVRAAATTQGTAVLIVEQHVDLALGIADRGYVLCRGELVLHDTAERLSTDWRRLTVSYFG